MNTLNQQDVILVVDDSADSLSLINDTLEQADISVLVALEGRQALTIAKRMKPDMILLDAIMPHMDGFETCRQLKADPELANIPVIFMTGLTETENVVKGLEVGGVDYLTKPIRPDELLARIRVHLNNARLTRSAHQALDSTGQNLLTVNDQGLLLWATPQTYHLLELAGLSREWLDQCFAHELAQWLAKKPEAQSSLSFEQQGKAVAVSFVEARSEREYLLKLIDDGALSSEQRLQTRFQLTTREAEVLRWVADGKTNREIGLILEISPRTVNKHLEQIFHKLKVENRTSAASVAIRALTEI